MPSLQCAAFRAFVTVIPGTWTSTATATRWHSAFVTVVTTLFQEMDTHCHAHDATRWISRELVCDQGLAMQSTKVPREPILITEKWRWKFLPALRASAHCLQQRPMDSGPPYIFYSDPALYGWSTLFFTSKRTQKWVVKRIMDNTVYIHVMGECTETLVWKIKIYMKGIVQIVSLGDLPPAEGQLGTRWLGGVGMISLPW